MVFIGGWRPQRRPVWRPVPRGYGPYGSPGYRGYGYGGGSCMRDQCMIQSGCCLAEMIGCGPQLSLLGPSIARRSWRAAGHTTRDGAGVREWLLRFSLAAIALYQSEISAKRSACCRFSPSCSHYAAEALRTHGLRRGLWLSVRRLLRCRPGASGGPDPVPPG